MEQNLTELEQNLNVILEEKRIKIIPENIKENEKIFDVVGTLKPEKKPNIFIQEEEPETKEGIWIQASGLTYNNIIVDTEMNTKETWDTENYPTLPLGLYDGSAASIGTDIFVFIDKYIYKYDTLTNLFTKMVGISSTFLKSGVTAIGTDIFVFIGTNAYKYDTLNDTYTTLATSPTSMADGNGGVASVGTDIYLMNITSLYKYDTITDTYTQLTNIPYRAKHGRITAVGTDLYIGGSETATTNQYMYKYNTLTNTYTKMQSIPVGCCQGSFVAVGNNIYIFVNTNAYKFNTDTNTYEKIEDVPYNFYRGCAACVDDKIYIFGGVNNFRLSRILKKEIAGYPDNSILLQEGNGGYKTQLVNSDIQGRTVTSIIDAWHYTTENGVNETLPTYYGDGIQWNCFKNKK